MATADVFLDRTARLLCQVARRQTRQVLQSRTLRRALACRLEKTGPRVRTARLSVPHYWAVYYHDGRRPIRPRRGKFLVYFRNVEDDPRLGGATASPERHAQTKRLSLSPKTFRRLQESGKLLVRTRVDSTTPRPFFRPLRQFQSRAAPIVSKRFSRHVRSELRAAGILRIRGVVTVRIAL